MKITGSPVRAVMLASTFLAIAALLAGTGPAVAASQPPAVSPGPAWPPFGPGAAGRPAAARKVPEPGETSILNGVFCTSSANCWAVGEWAQATGNPGLNQVLHWNGKNWSRDAVVSPGGTKGSGHSSELYAVRCTSAANCWAVGYYSTGRADLNQALHWNGRKWSLVPTPTPGGTLGGEVNELYDVVCPSSSDCWADGEYGTESAGDEVVLNEILYWNGRKWSLVRTPNPGGTGQDDVQAIDAIRCASARSCLAVGTDGNIKKLILRNEALSWNGRAWSRLTVPNPAGTTADGDINELIGLGCAGTDCWAAGTAGIFTTQTYLNEILHWTGHKWSVATTPDPDGTGTGASNNLEAASCISATSCWAVGSYGSVSDDTGSVLNQALHWNGKQWSLVTTPDPGGTANEDENELFGVRCTSAGNCWAVGEQEPSGDSPDFNEALHWTGTTWSAG